MTKKIIRDKIKSIRRELSKDIHKINSEIIYEKVITLDEYINAQTIYIYIDARNEVGTKNLILNALAQGKDVAVPKIEEGVMNFYQIHSFDELSSGYFGILEPDVKRIPRTPDIVIVPGVAFSLQKERLGYGGGFYDRYLTESITKIGLAFEFQLMEKIPVEEHDIKMDMIITESRIIQ